MVQKTANRPRDKNGRLKKMLTMETMINALREAGGGPSVTAELAEILDMDPRTIRAAYAQIVNKPWETPIKGRKSGGVWVFWLEEEKEEETEEKQPHHNVYKDGMQMICNLCGHKFKKGDTCHSIDRMEMVDKAEGEINAVLQVCEECYSKKLKSDLKNASWDLV